MNCTEAEAMILEGHSPQAHLEGCPSCRGFAQDTALALSSASLGPLTAKENEQLQRLASSVRPVVKARGGARRWVGYAMAAGLGALATWGALRVRAVEPTALPTGVVASRGGEEDEWNVAEEVSMEVFWPEIEGEYP